MKRLLLAALLCGCAVAPETPMAPVAAPKTSTQNNLRFDWSYDWAAWQATAPPEDSAFSPTSLAQPLTLLAAGAAGVTQSELCAALRAPYPTAASRR